MKKLYLVPIIHAGPDMGSIAPVLDEIGSNTLGQDSWRRHQGAVFRFWDSIAQFCQHLEVAGIKVYQDGVVADGEDGLKIVAEGARLGSWNYRIVSDLLQRGATLIKTEDLSLVKSEHSYISKLATAKSLREKETAALRYKLAERRLLEARDNYISSTIVRTLQDGETGILFIGGYHDVISRLPSDIEIVQVKEVARIKEYHTLLMRIDYKDRGRDLVQLAEYLASPVSIQRS
jgi:hypothetical protein